MKNIGKPCAGKPHARFDEGGLVKTTSSLLYPKGSLRVCRRASGPCRLRRILIPFQIHTVDEVIKDYAEKVVKMANGNRSKAAEMLGISRTSLWKILKEE